MATRVLRPSRPSFVRGHNQRVIGAGRGAQQQQQQACLRSHASVAPQAWGFDGLAPTSSVPTVARPTAHSIVARAVSEQASKPVVKVTLQGRKLQVTDAIKTYVVDKISKACEHTARAITRVDVTLSARGGDTGTKGTKEQRVEVTIAVLRNGVVRVEEAADSLYAAIDLVCDKIERKLTRVKERAMDKGKWPGHAGPHHKHLDEEEFQQYKEEVLYETQLYVEEQAMQQQFAEMNALQMPKTVMRTKVVEMDSMTPEEAIDAMEAVGHDFFVFRESTSDQLQVIYRRQSEGYGVLVPIKRD